MYRSIIFITLFILLVSPWILAQEDKSGIEPETGVTNTDLFNGFSNPSQWVTFSGDYSGQRHSPVSQITPENVRRLVPIWTFQTGPLAVGRGFETTPLVYNEILYVTGSNNFAWALDARTGKQIWRYIRSLPDDLTYGAAAPVNRGFGMLGNQLFMVTLDAYLIALDRNTGRVQWEVQLADYHIGYSATMAPLVVDGKVIVGISGGEYPTRGFIDAYDPQSGSRIWRLYTIPGPGEPGSETWPNEEVMARGGGGTWMTGTYDRATDLLYWGTGNPNPPFYGDDRQGDNLFANSILAIEAKTGKIRWHYQFTPHDTHDWDANQIPVLADLVLDGKPRQVVMVANRNSFFYILDRGTGELLFARPFASTEWAKEIGPDGRPVVLNEDGSKICLPDVWGGTNFMPPSFDPNLNYFFVTTRETCAAYYPQASEILPGKRANGGTVDMKRGKAYGALRAIDATTGDISWEYRYRAPTLAGVMSTAAGVVFSGDSEGNLIALESKTGELLWQYPAGSNLWGTAAMTFMLDGRQFIVFPSGSVLLAFALFDSPGDTD